MDEDMNETHRQAILEHIARTLANWSGLSEDTWYGCALCLAGYGGDANEEKPPKHDEDCPIELAKRALGQ